MRSSTPAARALGRRLRLLGLLATLALFAAAGLRAFWLEPDSLRVVDYVVPLRHCPPPLAGLRIAVLTDLHAGAPYIDLAKLRRVVAMSNAAKPDLTVIAGDIFVEDVLGGQPLPAEQVASVLGGLHAPLGVYAVLGNHDYNTDMPALYRLLLNRNGIVVIDNRALPIDRDGQRFWIAGFEDAEQGHPDIAGTLASIPADAPILALTHEPDLFRQMPARVNLLIAGHTHGGQVRLPLIGAPIVPSNFGQRYAAGHVVEQTDLFVSTGIGTSHLPVRFGVPPEISLLTLE